MTDPQEEKLHVFEKAGMGKAPYRYVGFWSGPSKGLQEANPDAYNRALAEGPRTERGIGACNYCGTAITNHYIIESADGLTFAVGSECISKCGDAGLKASVDTDKKRQARQKREARRRVLYEGYRATLEENKERLQVRPHPNAYFAGNGRTLLDYLAYMVGPGSSESRIRQANKIIETLPLEA